jgi:hypothetical protein
MELKKKIVNANTDLESLRESQKTQDEMVIQIHYFIYYLNVMTTVRNLRYADCYITNLNQLCLAGNYNYYKVPIIYFLKFLDATTSTPTRHVQSSCSKRRRYGGMSK